MPKKKCETTELEQFLILLEKDEIALYAMKTADKYRMINQRQLSLAFTKMQECRFWVTEAVKRIEIVNGEFEKKDL